jgi:predicted NAD/FAD-binding protein
VIFLSHRSNSCTIITYSRSPANHPGSLSKEEGPLFSKCLKLLIDGSLSKVYVNSILTEVSKDRVHLSTPVESLESLPSGQVQLRTSNGQTETFDHVVLACHSDTTIKILKAGNASPEELRILGKFGWNRNEAVLHTDTRVSLRT